MNAVSWVPTASAPWSSAIRARSMKARVSSWRRSGVGGLRLTPRETFMARAVSHRLEGAVRRGWQLHLDRVAGPHRPAGQHDRHDAGLAHEPAARVALEGGLHQARGDPVELGARIAEAGHLDQRALAQAEARARRQGQEIDAASRDVLAHLAGDDAE